MVSLDEVATRLDDGLDGIGDDQVLALINEAEALVVGYLGRDFTGQSVPDPVRFVVARMVARVLESPKEQVHLESLQASAGPFAHTAKFGHGGSGGAPWLSATDKTMLAPYRRRRRGVYSMTLG